MNIIIPVAMVGGIIALAILAKKEQASYIPTSEQIMMSGSLTELEAWYILINELVITEEISGEEYHELFNAYSTRYYEIVREGL